MIVAGLPLWVWPGVALVAALYGSVGHGGASGYIALLVLAGLAAERVAFPALALNLIVAGLAAWNFHRAGHLRWSLLWPFAVTSVPMAFLGGAWRLPPHVYRIVLGLTLLAGAARFLLLRQEVAARPLPVRFSVIGPLMGAVLGFVSGLVGVGGGIFLSPLLLILGWADAKQTAAVSALFIWVNSLAGIIARQATGRADWQLVPLLVVAVLMGGALGSWLGAHRIPRLALQRLTGGVLLTASVKLLW